MLDSGVQYPKMINKRKGIHVHSLEYEVIEGYKHIGLDEKGVPYIQGTTMKIVELVAEYTEYKWGVEQLHIQHPHLSRAQICSALAYYWDHKAEIDADIERRIKLADEIFEELGPSPLSTKLRAKGFL
jgi:uncharacterized protein (DUF433 family)